MTTDQGPLWLRICIAVVPPLLAAMIAGYFALSNTVNRRTERLRNLNDIRSSSNSDAINPRNILSRMMLRELEDLELATTPVLRWEPRIKRAFFPVSIALIYSTVLAHQLHLLQESLGAWLFLIFVISFFLFNVLAILLFAIKWNTTRMKNTISAKYKSALSELTRPAANAKMSPRPGMNELPDMPGGSLPTGKDD